MTIRDQELRCEDCAVPFVWTVGEQEFWADKGLSHPPKRCRDCRRAQREALDAPGWSIRLRSRYMNTWADQERRCNICKHLFVLTERDLAWFARKNLSPPKRCRDCRAARRTCREAATQGHTGERTIW